MWDLFFSNIYVMNIFSMVLSEWVDFIETHLTPSLESSCYEDSITILINPTTGNYNTPFCGYLNGYSTVMEVISSSEVKIIALTQSNGAIWKIRLTQIQCSEITFPTEDTCGFQIPFQFQRNLNISNGKGKQTKLKGLQLKDNLYLRNVKRNISANIYAQSYSKHGKQIIKENIFNGQEVIPHQFPWIAVLLLDSSLRCAASLITHEWLLTAGHCIELSSSETLPIKRLEVLLGAHDISAKEPNTITKSLSNIVRHPSLLGVNHDIALLRLFDSVAYSSNIQPLCLPTAGWGMTGSGSLSPRLLKTSAPLVSRTMCQTAWKRMDTPIANYTVCSTAQACGGDSGGPLMAQDENGVYYIIGIVSFGPVCGDPSLPQVFMKVPSFLHWIAAVLVENI